MAYINLKDATGTAYPSGVHEFTPVLSGVRVFLFLVCLLCIVLPPLIVFVCPLPLYFLSIIYL